MIDFIKDLVAEAKASENHTAAKCMSYSAMMDATKKGNSSFANFCEEMSAYMKENDCTFSYVAEGTMAPVITVRYHADEPNIIFDGAKFGKAYKRRGGDKALFICCEDKVIGDVTVSCAKVYSQRDGEYYVCLDGDARRGIPNDVYDIVGEWDESIDDDELNFMAFNYMVNLDEGGGPGCYDDTSIEVAYKEGFRKCEDLRG